MSKLFFSQIERFKMRLVNAGLICFVFIHLLAGQSYSKEKDEASIFNAEEFFLDNGMHVVLIQDNRAPIVSHMIWYKVGSADEPQGQSGIAHFLEHLMFKGTRKFPEGEMSQIVARSGGNQNAFTSYDYTAYYQNVPKDKLQLMMELESDRMKNLILKPSEIDTERQVVLEERRMRVDSSPFALLSERLNASLWVTNHYSIPIIGWENEINKISEKNLFDFYKKWYVPNNSILIVAGDISLDSLRDYASSTYGAIPSDSSFVSRSRSSYLPPKVDIRITMNDDRVRQSRWYKTYISPSINVGEKSDTYALSLFNEIFGSGITSRLYQSLVVKQRLATSASSYYNDSSVSWGSFSILVTPASGVNVKDVENAINVELNKIINSGITENELTIAKKRIIADLIYIKDSPIQASRSLGSLLSTGFSLRDIEDWPNNIQQVSLDDINSITSAFLKSAPNAVGVLLPQGGEE